MPKTQKLSGFVFKRANSPFYYARWWVKGKEHVQSTERKTKPEAEIVKDRLVALSKGDYSLEKAFNDFLSALSTFEDLEERERLRCKFARRLASGANEKLVLVEGWKAWLDNPNKKRTPKKSTLTGYKAIWNRFASWSGRNDVEYLHELDRGHAERYAEDLWKSHVSPSTFNAHIKLLTNIFKVLETSAGLSENVWARITRKDKTPDQGRRNFTEQELRIILNRAEGNQRVMFVLGLFTGLRMGDVVNLRWTEPPLRHSATTPVRTRKNIMQKGERIGADKGSDHIGDISKTAPLSEDILATRARRSETTLSSASRLTRVRWISKRNRPRKVLGVKLGRSGPNASLLRWAARSGNIW